MLECERLFVDSASTEASCVAWLCFLGFCQTAYVSAIIGGFCRNAYGIHYPYSIHGVSMEYLWRIYGVEIFGWQLIALQISTK